MSKDFPVRGLKELDAYLSHLPENLQKGAYRAGLRAAGNVIRDEARRRAPKKTGAMAKSIKTGSPRSHPKGFSVSVRLKGRHAFLGRFHEYGVVPHFISVDYKGLAASTVNKKVKRGELEREALKINGKFVSGTVAHPGHIARPFMRPALDIKAEEAIGAFADRIRAYIEGKTGFAAPVGEAA